MSVSANQPVTYVPDPAKADGAAVSGGSGNADMIYVSDPNAENLKPVDPGQPCTAYAFSGTGAFYGWNPALQTWV